MIRRVVSVAVMIGIIAFWILFLNGEVEQFLSIKFDKRGWKRNFVYYVLGFLVWYFVIEMLSYGTYRLLHSMFPYLYTITYIQ